MNFETSCLLSVTIVILKCHDSLRWCNLCYWVSLLSWSLFYYVSCLQGLHSGIWTCYGADLRSTMQAIWQWLMSRLLISVASVRTPYRTIRRGWTCCYSNHRFVAIKNKLYLSLLNWLLFVLSFLNSRIPSCRRAMYVLCSTALLTGGRETSLVNKYDHDKVMNFVIWLRGFPCLSLLSVWCCFFASIKMCVFWFISIVIPSQGDFHLVVSYLRKNKHLKLPKSWPADW